MNDMQTELAQRQSEIVELKIKVALLPSGKFYISLFDINFKHETNSFILNVFFSTVQKEIEELRTIISSSQRSVLFNFCSTNKIENEGIEIGQSIVKLKTQSGKTKQKF